MAPDVRPVERVFIGDPDVSEAVYRLLKAAREGRIAQEEVRVAGLKGRPVSWLRLRVRPLRSGSSDGMTLWIVADVTRDRERQENIFQELQHAIDYLDHAPAGFFSVDAEGSIVLSQCDAGGLARPRPGAGRLRRVEARRHRFRQRRGAAHHARCRARRSEDRSLRHRLQDPRRTLGAGAAVPQGRVRRRRRARAPRARWCSIARAARRPIRSAPPKCASCASSSRRRWRSPRWTRPGSISRTNALFARLFQSSLKGDSERSILSVVAERDRAALEAAIRQRRRRAERHRRRSTPRWPAATSAGRASMSRRSRTTSATRKPPSSTRSKPPTSACWRTRSTSAPEWNRSASSPAASRTTSTTCCPPS